MNRVQSLYLDLLRLCSAMAVVLYHFARHIHTYDQQTGLYPVFPDVGQEAVMVFFLLSGFIISYVANGKENSFLLFMSKRASRFYSVVLPSIIVVIAAYYLTVSVDPQIYSTLGRGSMSHGIGKTVATLLFVNHNEFFTVMLPGGVPFWSLVCEWWYYVLFAIFCFYPSRIFSLLVAILIFACSSSLTRLLLPVWFLGVIWYHMDQAFLTRKKWAVTGVVLSGVGMGLLWVSSCRYTILNTKYLFGRDIGYLATEHPYFWAFGLVLGANLFFTFQLLRNFSEPDSIIYFRFKGAVRFLVGSSFFLYLVHMPLMILIKAWCGPLMNDYWIPFVVIAVCGGVGHFVERLRVPLHGRLYPLLCMGSRKLLRIHWVSHALETTINRVT